MDDVKSIKHKSLLVIHTHPFIRIFELDALNKLLAVKRRGEYW